MIGLIPHKYNQKFSLKSLSVECKINNLLISCKSEFVYKNEEDEDVEAIFSFPLDSNCVVYDFEAVIGNKTIVGVCKEVEEAKNLYKAAVETGHMAAMIQRNTSMTDVFKCSIGNFPKKSEAKIVIKFSMELLLSLARSKDESVDRFNLALPLILNPRYSPTEYQGDHEVFQVSNKYEYHFKAVLNGTKVINNVSSVNHKLGFNYTDQNHTCAEVVLLSTHDGTKDLDVNIDYIAMREPTVFYELGTHSSQYSGKKVDGAFYQPDVAMVNFLPKFKASETETKIKTEIVFVVDRSGSMDGSNIEKAKECLLIFLKSLPENCKFQIYGFGSTFDKAFNDSQLYTDQSIAVALAYQKNMNADMGGTELMRPLGDLYNAVVPSDYTRVVFLLTDGDVGNQDEVIRLVRKHNKSTRLFTVGIGDGVSTSLVSKVADAGFGKSAFVRNTEDLSANVIELLDVALNSDPFIDCKIEWKCPPHVSIVSAPKVTPPIFSDYFLTIFCMIQGMKKGDVIHCTLSGKMNEKVISFTMDISDAHAFVDDEFRVHRLLAKYKIEEMTVQIQDGQEDIKKSLIDLSTEVNIVTNWTTFVAIDPDAPANGLVTFTPEVQYYNMPVLLGGGGSPFIAMSRCSAPASNMKSCSVLFGSMATKKMKKSSAYDSVDGPLELCLTRSMDDDSCGEEELNEPEREITPVDIIMFLVEKQNINGSWKYDEAIFDMIEVDLLKMKEKKPVKINDDIWTTILVYQYLVIEQQSREKEWRLFAKKAKLWIEKNLDESHDLNNAYLISAELFQ